MFLVVSNLPIHLSNLTKGNKPVIILFAKKDEEETNILYNFEISLTQFANHTRDQGFANHTRDQGYVFSVFQFQ